MSATPQTDGAFYYDSGAALPADRILKPLPGWNTDWRCRAIVAFRYFLVALNMTEVGDAFPHKLRWSNSAQEGDLPTEWVAAISNDAGDDLLGETSGVIVGGTVVRDQLYVVKEDAIYAMSWIGGEYVMRTDRLKGGVGTRLDKGFAQMQGGIVVFTTSDVLFFDGQNSRSLVDGRDPEHHQGGDLRGIVGVLAGLRQSDHQQPDDRRRLCRQPATDVVPHLQLPREHLGASPPEFWLRVRLCSGHRVGEPSDRGTNSVDVAPLNPYQRMVPGKTWDQQNDGSWNKGIYQPSVQDVLVYESNDADTLWWVSVIALSDSNSDGSAKLCRAERTGIPIEGADGLAMITEVWPEAVGTIPLRITIGGMDAENSTPNWDTPITFTPGVTNSITPRITGRFICIRVESEAIGNWSLGALTYNWERAGER